MKFPPINLWSKPVQSDYEKELETIDALDAISTSIEYKRIAIESVIKLAHEQKQQAQKRLQMINFIHYCRTGRFIDE